MKGGSVLKDGKSYVIYTKNIYGMAGYLKRNVCEMR